MQSIVLYCIVLYCIVLYCIVLYCIVLYCTVFETKTIFMLYLFNQRVLPFTLVLPCWCKRVLNFLLNTAVSLSYDICSAFQSLQHFPIVGNFLYAMIESNE